VLYFYERAEAVLQCEVRDTAVADTFAIVLTEPDGRVRTRYVRGSNDAHRLWLAIEQQLRATGWSGPVGLPFSVR
jgi:metal-dependent HD superfamily phosphatase/phosphodiesterase